MSKIKKVHARQVFDSRGNPTVEAEVVLQDGSVGNAIVPSGASTGRYEAHELRDKNKDYLNKSVFDAVNNINNKISVALINKGSTNQNEIDKILINLDGTENKSNIGANAILAVSIANLKAAAARIQDTDYALETANLTKAAILNQSAMAMVAQANQAQQAILTVIQ